MTDRAIMQQALEALEGIQWPGSPSFVKAAITALRERLAQPDGKQLNAYKLLVKSLEEQLSHHRSQADKYREAIATLQSERQANAVLTEEVERLAQPEQDAVLAEREACAALVDRNAMGCDNPIYRSLLQANAAAIRAMGEA